jgi:Putative abortive phage resistance protein AbiGi, antitoxin
MLVSADTLFHFTDSYEKLESILINKFQITYCHEKYTLNYQTHDSYYPIVSFCDLPLSLAKGQIDKYGSYAIGLTKDWAIINKLNPVIYIESNSLVANDIQASIKSAKELVNVMSKQLKLIPTSLAKISQNSIFQESNASRNNQTTPWENKRIQLTKELEQYHNEKEQLENSQKLLNSLQEMLNVLKESINNDFNLFRYIKNYQGVLERSNKIIPNYRFYDEREWRYVPALDDKRVKQSLNIEEYQKYRSNFKEKPFIPNISLTFNADDIKYLIVQTSEDIPKLISVIKKAGSLTGNSEAVDILTTKILTVEQLKKDF